MPRDPVGCSVRRPFRRPGLRRGARIAAVFGTAVLGSLTAVSEVEAQRFEGRVRGQRDLAPVATALVKLVDEDGDDVAITIADATGVYRLDAEEPGLFRLVAERIGFQPFESPLLEARDRSGVYPIDIEMTPVPIEIEGLTVLSENEADRSVQQIIGLSPKSLRFRPVTYEQILNHLDRAHSLVDVVRWEFAPQVLIRETSDGPCFEWRSQHCLPVYLNSMRLDQFFMPDVPLDMVHRLHIITPSDGSVIYPGGALLLFTESWLR